MSRAVSLVLLLLADRAVGLRPTIRSPTLTAARGDESGKQLTPASARVLALRAGMDKAGQIGIGVGGDLVSQIQQHGLTYAVWLYAAAFGAYSLRIYCFSCGGTPIKSLIPAFFVLQLLWRLSDSWMQRFQDVPNSAVGSPKAALEMLHQILRGLNVLTTAAVLVDMLQCFVQQARHLAPQVVADVATA